MCAVVWIWVLTEIGVNLEFIWVPPCRVSPTCAPGRRVCNLADTIWYDRHHIEIQTMVCDPAAFLWETSLWILVSNPKVAQFMLVNGCHVACFPLISPLHTGYGVPPGHLEGDPSGWPSCCAFHVAKPEKWLSLQALGFWCWGYQSWQLLLWLHLEMCLDVIRCHQWSAGDCKRRIITFWLEM